MRLKKKGVRSDGTKYETYKCTAKNCGNYEIVEKGK